MLCAKSASHDPSQPAPVHFYSHEDKEFVSPIVRLLTAMRNDIFIDSASIEPGTLWLDSITAAIRQAEVVVVFWCEHSEQSEWVKAEWELGTSLQKKVMPLLLDDTALPPALSRFQGIDFRSIAGHARAQPARLYASALPALILLVVLERALGSQGQLSHL